MTGGSQDRNGQPGTHKVHDSCVGHLPLCGESGSKALQTSPYNVRKTTKISTTCTYYREILTVRALRSSRTIVKIG